MPHNCHSSGSAVIVGSPPTIDDSTMNAPFARDGKLSSMNPPHLLMRIASSASSAFGNLLNSRSCDLVRLNAVYLSLGGVRK